MSAGFSSPESIFLLISITLWVILMYNEYNGYNSQCKASFQCAPISVWTYMIYFVCIIAWAGLINYMSSRGMTPIGWILVPIPYIAWFFGYSLTKNTYIPQKNINTNAQFYM